MVFGASEVESCLMSTKNTDSEFGGRDGGQCEIKILWRCEQVNVKSAHVLSQDGTSSNGKANN